MRRADMLNVARLIYGRLYRLVPCLDGVPIIREPYVLEKEGEVPVNFFVEKRTFRQTWVNLCRYPFDNRRQPMPSPHVGIVLDHVRKEANAIVYVDVLEDVELKSHTLRTGFNKARQIDICSYGWLSGLERKGFGLTTVQRGRGGRLPPACRKIFHQLCKLAPWLATIQAGGGARLGAAGLPDLGMEVLLVEPGKTQIALSLISDAPSGGMAAGSRMKIQVHHDLLKAEALVYLDDTVCREVYPYDGMVNTKAMQELNDALCHWLDTVLRQGYRLKTPQDPPPFFPALAP